MATTTLHEDYLGRDLSNEDSAATDYLGRATTSSVDYLGRALTVGTWTATHAYGLGALVELSTGEELVVTTAGTSSDTEPTPPEAKGDTVEDGTVVWTRNE
jgi:hypothetical protein